MTYTYKCDNCDEYMVVEHGMMERPDVVCPTCDNPARKIIANVVSVIYKGTGFASTELPRKTGLEE